MRVLQIIILAFLFISCEQRKQRDDIALKDAFTSVYEVSEINDRLVNNPEIDLAPGAWHSALKLKARVNDFSNKEYCLLVKTPYELEPGKLKFVQVEGSNNCSDSIFNPAVGKEYDFYNLFIEYRDSVLSINPDKEKIGFNFFNLKSEAVEISIDGQLNSKSEAKLKDGQVCRQVLDSCEVTIDECDRCENSSYYVKNSACSSAYSKVCGIDNCGEKNNPACIRGEVATGVKDYCIQDSPVGFCIGAARVGCVDKMLICE